MAIVQLAKGAIIARRHARYKCAVRRPGLSLLVRQHGLEVDAAYGLLQRGSPEKVTPGGDRRIGDPSAPPAYVGRRNIRFQRIRTGSVATLR